MPNWDPIAQQWTNYKNDHKNVSTPDALCHEYVDMKIHIDMTTNQDTAQLKFDDQNQHQILFEQSPYLHQKCPHTTCHKAHHRHTKQYLIVRATKLQIQVAQIEAAHH
jgi:hypothetical protein